MKNVPHWQWLMVLYFVMVAIPVWLVHNGMKKRLLNDRTMVNMFLYFITVLGTAFLMHFLVMWLYFSLIFPS